MKAVLCPKVRYCESGVAQTGISITLRNAFAKHMRLTLSDQTSSPRNGYVTLSKSSRW